MIDINSWLNKFTDDLNETFSNRIWFVGLQGSYARNEANEDSDIDIVVILDELTANDIRSYSLMLDRLPHREKICGFLSGKSEIFNWEISDLFQFICDTKPIKGTLDELFSLIDADAVNRAIRIGACNIYHGCVHNMLHEKNVDILKGLYKSASFVVQAICYKQTGEYIRLQKDLLLKASCDEKTIIENYLSLKNGTEIDFEMFSATLFNWSKSIISK